MPEAIAFEHYLGAAMTMFENNHRQFEMGFLSKEHWQRNVRELECTLDSPFRRQIVAGWQYRGLFSGLIGVLASDHQADGRFSMVEAHLVSK